MLAKPEARPGVGVKVAVNTLASAVAETVPKVPPVTKMLLASVVRLTAGTSLKVKVIAAVWPALSVAVSLPMVSVGARVSMLMLGELPAAPVLPAASL